MEDSTQLEGLGKKRLIKVKASEPQQKHRMSEQTLDGEIDLDGGDEMTGRRRGASQTSGWVIRVCSARGWRGKQSPAAVAGPTIDPLREMALGKPKCTISPGLGRQHLLLSHLPPFLEGRQAAGHRWSQSWSPARTVY